jgi:hypothetical protein
VRKLRNIFFGFVYIVCIAAPIPSIASEKVETSNTGHFSVGIGWEALNYSEHEPVNRLDSEADVSNWIVGLDAFKEWANIFCEFKGIMPINRIDDSEEWRVSDMLTQQNSLKYGWSRIDALLGYSFKPFFIPYIGFRWSDSKQERTDFVVIGTPVGGSATEEVTSWFISLGIKGNFLLSHRLTLSYFGSYFEPISSEVDNSNLPGWEVTVQKDIRLNLRAKQNILTPKVYLLYSHFTEERCIGTDRGTFVQNVHNFILMSSTSCSFPAEIIRVTHEFVTPRYPSTLASE